jgi:hypothetical protein
MKETPDRVLTITRWSETFENSDTRKRSRLGWYLAPSGCDSSGYVELVTCHGSAGLVAFGIFNALCQLSATLPAKIRGRLAKSNGDAMSLRQIALLIRVEICHLVAAIELLEDETVGWVKWEPVKTESATSGGGNLPPRNPASATTLPPTAGFVKGEGEGEGEGKGEVIINGRENTPEWAVDDDDEWRDTMPTEAAKRMQELQSWINSLHPSWTKRPHFSAKELHALRDNAKAWMAVTRPERVLLHRYLDASIPDAWRRDPKDFFQPDVRLALINAGPSAMLGLADRWLLRCTREGITVNWQPQPEPEQP